MTIMSCTSNHEKPEGSVEPNSKIMKEKVLYIELTPKEFRKRVADAPIAYVPLGTLEWHGEHLPLGADGIQPYYFFQELAAEVGGIVLPMLHLGPDAKMEENGEEYYGMDRGQYQDDPEKQYERQKLAGGAYWVPDSLFEMIIESTVKQLARQGFKIIVAHGHGPSTVNVQNRKEYLEEKYDVKIFNLWGTEDDEWKGFMTDHAAMGETSIVMYYRPDLVQMENIPADTSQWPVGVGGHDPRIYASHEKGQEIVEFNKKRIVKILNEELSKL